MKPAVDYRGNTVDRKRCVLRGDGSIEEGAALSPGQGASSQQASAASLVAPVVSADLSELTPLPSPPISPPAHTAYDIDYRAHFASEDGVEPPWVTAEEPTNWWDAPGGCGFEPLAPATVAASSPASGASSAEEQVVLLQDGGYCGGAACGVELPIAKQLASSQHVDQHPSCHIVMF